MGFPLPPELISIVLKYLTDDEDIHAAPYATVNRCWQTIIERRTFSDLQIGTAKRLAEFNQMSWNRRRCYVRHIYFVVELESYDGEARTRYENEEEIQRNNKIFTTSIQSLFNTLSEWPKTESRLALMITAQSPGDIGAQTTETWDERNYGEPDYLGDDFWDHRSDRSYLQFDEVSIGTKCPAVLVITKLGIRGGGIQRQVEPASSSLIVSKLPQLDELHLVLNDDCKWDPEKRKRQRIDFADSIQLWPSSVRHLHFAFYYSAPSDENYPPAVLTLEGEADLLSSRLREFSQQLTEMTGTECVLGKEIFWPITVQNDLQLPFWPHLIGLGLGCTPVTPCGKWMFGMRDSNGRDDEDAQDDEDDEYGEDDEGDEDMDNTHRAWVAPEDRRLTRSRTKIIYEFFNQYYISAAKAALQMPKLKGMSLGMTDSRAPHEFLYRVQNGVARVTWYSKDDLVEPFEPNDEVLEAWEKVAWEHTGCKLEVEC